MDSVVSKSRTIYRDNLSPSVVGAIIIHVSRLNLCSSPSFLHAFERRFCAAVVHLTPEPSIKRPLLLTFFDQFWIASSYIIYFALNLIRSLNPPDAVADFLDEQYQPLLKRLVDALYRYGKDWISCYFPWLIASTRNYFYIQIPYYLTLRQFIRLLS